MTPDWPSLQQTIQPSSPKKKHSTPRKHSLFFRIQSQSGIFTDETTQKFPSKSISQKKVHLALHLLQKTWICDLPGEELVCHGALRMGYGSQNHGNVESEKNAWPSFSKRFTILLINRKKRSKLLILCFNCKWNLFLWCHSIYSWKLRYQSKYKFHMYPHMFILSQANSYI